MFKCGQIQPEGVVPAFCARDVQNADDLCCNLCGTGSHTPECNVKQFNTPASQYYHDASRADTIINRLANALALSTALEGEFREIRGIAQSLSLGWGPHMESLLAHLQIDHQYLTAGIKGLLGKG